MKKYDKTLTKLANTPEEKEVIREASKRITKKHHKTFEMLSKK